MQCHGEGRHGDAPGHGVADKTANFPCRRRVRDRLAETGVLPAFRGTLTSRRSLVESALDVTEAPFDATLPVLERELDTGHDACLTLAQVLIEPIVGCASLLADRAPLFSNGAALLRLAALGLTARLVSITPHRLVTYDHESRRGCFRRGR
jgi:hypothetical protein